MARGERAREPLLAGKTRRNTQKGHLGSDDASWEKFESVGM